MRGATRRDADTEWLVARAGPRLAASGAVGLAVFAGFLLAGRWQLGILAGWSLTMVVWISWVWLGVGHLNPAATRRVATREDSSRVAADLVLILASLVNLVGVVFALVEASGRPRLEAVIIGGVVVVSVSLSWTALHTVYALRYARLYYQDGGGIDFGEETPDYADFAYLAFTLGMTYQVSDTRLTSRALRRIALRHTLLSYLFGVVIAATIINVIAGLFRA